MAEGEIDGVREGPITDCQEDAVRTVEISSGGRGPTGRLNESGQPAGGGAPAWSSLARGRPRMAGGLRLPQLAEEGLDVFDELLGPEAVKQVT